MDASRRTRTLHRPLESRYISTEPLLLFPVTPPFLVKRMERHVQNPLQDIALTLPLDALD
jgi:hypothetical protein